MVSIGIIVEFTLLTVTYHISSFLKVAKQKKLSKTQQRRVKANFKRKLSEKKSQATENVNDLSSCDTLNGVVVSRYGQHADILTGEGKILRCNIRRNLFDLVTGDKILWSDTQIKEEDGFSGVIEAVYDRTSVLKRPDFYDGLKPVAANVDQIIVVTSVLPAYSAHILDRYIVAIEDIGIEPVILLNKTDLLDEQSQADINTSLDLYSSFGYRVEKLSAKDDGVEAQLMSLLKDKSSVFVGQSGVGKSSLINAILPNEDVLEGEVSDNSGLGQHTTTTARLYPLECGGNIIDSPGIREFSLWHMEKDQVTSGFREFRDYIGTCKFRDCKHLNDPGCAIIRARDEGQITEERFDSYHKIIDSMDQQKPAYTQKQKNKSSRMS